MQAWSYFVAEESQLLRNYSKSLKFYQLITNREKIEKGEIKRVARETIS